MVSQAAVAGDGARFAGGVPLGVEHGGFDWDDLGGKAIFGPGLGGELLAAETELIALFAGDAPLVGHAFGALEL